MKQLQALWMLLMGKLSLLCFTILRLLHDAHQRLFMIYMIRNIHLHCSISDVTLLTSTIVQLFDLVQKLMTSKLGFHTNMLLYWALAVHLR
jgi:hypothetical protein